MKITLIILLAGTLTALTVAVHAMRTAWTNETELSANLDSVRIALRVERAQVKRLVAELEACEKGVHK